MSNYDLSDRVENASANVSTYYTGKHNSIAYGEDAIKRSIAEAQANLATLEPDYKFNEGFYIDLLKKYIDSTYNQHYAVGKLQATEFIIDMGDGVGFTRGNVIKYVKRYGQKAGRNKDDLLKVLHYALMLLYVHDLETEGK